MSCKAIEDYCKKYKIPFSVDETYPPQYTFNLKTQRDGDAAKPTFTPNESTSLETIYLRVKIYLDDCLKTDSEFVFPLRPSQYSDEMMIEAKRAVVDYCSEQEIICNEDGVDEDGIPVFSFQIPKHVKQRILQEQMAIQRKGDEKSE